MLTFKENERVTVPVPALVAGAPSDSSAAFGRTSVARRVHWILRTHRAPIPDSRALDAGANTSRSVVGRLARENQHARALEGRQP